MKIIDTDSNVFTELVDFECIRNSQISINISDYYNNNKTVIYYNPYKVIGNDSDGGSCEIITE